MDCAWKTNWAETKKHFVDWWNHEGLVVCTFGVPGDHAPREDVADPAEPESIEQQYLDVQWRRDKEHYCMSRGSFRLDTLAIAKTDMGPGSLATFIGSEPGFSPETVWFNPSTRDRQAPETWAPLRFDAGNRWWRLTEATVKACVEAGRGKYLVGCPDLVENIDILASLRGSQTMLMDLVERGGWVSEKLFEINEVFFEAYRRIYDTIKLPDGSAAFGAFRIWGPGKTAKVQCDASAMFSPEMFERFVSPALAAQCDWLDYSMFHLDGHECIRHLDALLAIEPLGAIEWTPDPQVPRGGDPCWYDMYRRILGAGKSVQALGIAHDQIAPLLDAVGPAGMYITTDLSTEACAEKVARIVEPYRG